MLMPVPPPPKSCDTFVYVQAPSTGLGTLFGKNSDRPSEEHHEVIRIEPQRHAENEVVKCTHISVSRPGTETLECILSRPSWLWGCEMGANSAGVVGGNEAVFTLLSDELLHSDGTPNKSLLGMDLLRLALEMGTTAKHAVEICIHFLEKYGQGGPCSEGDDKWSYENSFIFADANEAYVLETAGKRHWAYERVGPGEYRNISNGISIRCNWEAVSNDIKSICKDKGWWSGKSEFDWKRSVDMGGTVKGLDDCGGRELAGREHLDIISKVSDGTQAPRWWVEKMADILRDEESSICFRDRFGFCSTGSQISWLPTAQSKYTDIKSVASHFFTGASDPLCGTSYKLFTFDDPIVGDGDHKTGKLWNLWRERVLQRSTLTESVRDAISKIEMEGLSFMEGSFKGRRKTFAELVEEEIELLERERRS